MSKIENVIELVKPRIEKEKKIDMETIFDALYGCGVWLSENEISEASKILRNHFNIKNPKELND